MSFGRVGISLRNVALHGSCNVRAAVRKVRITELVLSEVKVISSITKTANFTDMKCLVCYLFLSASSEMYCRDDQRKYSL
ncbi:CASP-like protein 2B1 [Bienertia sinuspersici]